MKKIIPALSGYMAIIGAKGGSVKGRCKARTREQAQKAAAARWKGHVKKVRSMLEVKGNSK
jgi:hypothetical protein